MKKLHKLPIGIQDFIQLRVKVRSSYGRAEFSAKAKNVEKWMIVA